MSNGSSLISVVCFRERSVVILNIVNLTFCCYILLHQHLKFILASTRPSERYHNRQRKPSPRIGTNSHPEDPVCSLLRRQRLSYHADTPSSHPIRRSPSILRRPPGLLQHLRIRVSIKLHNLKRTPLPTHITMGLRVRVSVRLLARAHGRGGPGRRGLSPVFR